MFKAPNDNKPTINNFLIVDKIFVYNKFNTNIITKYCAKYINLRLLTSIFLLQWQKLQLSNPKTRMGAVI
jgi:hypothetical protein